MSELKLTSDFATFENCLREGDVLLFDALAPISGLIQWADRAPVNHCGVFLGGGEIAHAQPVEPFAIERKNLSDKVNVRDVRTVTALRHKKVLAQPEAATKFLKLVEGAMVTPSKFAMEHLYRLAPFALARAYLGDATWLVTNRVGLFRLLPRRQVENLVKDLALRATGKVLAEDQADGWTCSEFVHHCLQEAGLEVDRYEAPRTVEVASTEDAAEVTERFWLEESWRQVRSDGDPAQMVINLQHAGGQALLKLLLQEVQGKRPQATHQQSTGNHPDETDGKPLPSPVRSDTVTPGDLWRSASLIPVAVLHRPPPRSSARPNGSAY